MVKQLVFILFFVPIIVFSQEKNNVVDKGLVRFQGTISVGKLLSMDETNIFLTGNLEYYVSSQISVRGDMFHFLKNDENILNKNHQLFSGASYHIKTGNNFNPYFGFQPGLALSQSFNGSKKSLDNLPQTTSGTSVSPLISSVFGFNYYASKWFHLFIDGRLVHGRHLSNYKPVSLNEVRISFGLGFNFNALKKK
ncbi:MAG: hypothetical protein RQ875_05600 [Vicingaceae bacterium]|nr:hypothetical protein [Vicingaceae bacterium]